MEDGPSDLEQAHEDNLEKASTRRPERYATSAGLVKHPEGKMPDAELPPDDQPPISAPPPTRASDRAGWLHFRNDGFADVLRTIGQGLTALADTMVTARYADDARAAAVLHLTIDTLEKVRQFYANEVWISANEEATELLAATMANAEAPGLVEALSKLLAANEDPGASSPDEGLHSD